MKVFILNAAFIINERVCPSVYQCLEYLKVMTVSTFLRLCSFQASGLQSETHALLAPGLKGKTYAHIACGLNKSDFSREDC